MVWTPEFIRVFIGGCILGSIASFLITYFAVSYMAEKESEEMAEKYKALRLECNSLERKNYKLIRFIKERQWSE